ncbi:hypothetical protein J6590_091035 [Homalodisca vitripennis]|nr:hypothetical protein J6590_091035 [Homalodisca vitripennis]
MSPGLRAIVPFQLGGQFQKKVPNQLQSLPVSCQSLDDGCWGLKNLVDTAHWWSPLWLRLEVRLQVQYPSSATVPLSFWQPGICLFYSYVSHES